MIAHSIANRVLRGSLATVAAAMVAFLVPVVEDSPSWFSASEPPTTLPMAVLGGLVFAAAVALLLSVWLLPGCIVVRWAMSRRHVRGVLPAAAIGLLAGALASATPMLWAALEWPPERATLFKLVSVGGAGLLFVSTWLVAFEALSPRAHLAYEQSPPTDGSPRPLMSRVGRTTFETLALSAAFAWVAALGLFAGIFLAFFGDDGTYCVEQTADSPDHAKRAYAVFYAEPGGALTGGEMQVYVLNSSETWSRKHRGSLLWRSPRIDVAGLRWDSRRDLLVDVRAGSRGCVPEDAEAYSRDGVTAHTASDSLR